MGLSLGASLLGASSNDRFDALTKEINHISWAHKSCGSPRLISFSSCDLWLSYKKEIISLLKSKDIACLYVGSFDFDPVTPQINLMQSLHAMLSEYMVFATMQVNDRYLDMAGLPVFQELFGIDLNNNGYVKPTFLIIKNGVVVETLGELTTKGELCKKLTESYNSINDLPLAEKLKSAVLKSEKAYEFIKNL